jgi:hypothetical protein
MKVWVRNFCNVVKPTPISGFAFRNKWRRIDRIPGRIHRIPEK